MIAHLRKTFEALRGEDIDIDAVVETYADVMSGMEMSERLFIKKQTTDYPF